MAPLSVFYAFRDAPERRAALRSPVGAPERYRLFGLDELGERADSIHHNLQDGRPPAWARAASRAVNAAVYGTGGYGGDFATVLASLRNLNRADVVLSTVDTVGIPLLLLKRVGLVRAPLVYVSIGLPERLEQLRGRRMQQLYARALRGAQAIVAYAQSEAEELRNVVGAGGPRVIFVPFGVDVHAFRPAPEVTQDLDVLSVGADPRRDFDLLLRVAARRPNRGFHIVAGPEHTRTLQQLPENVAVESGLTLEEVRDRLARARVVALPVRDNSYSGGTTVLLQAMAMAKPVVVSRTAAVADGYELEDGVNCRLVAPGDAQAFEHALDQETGADAVCSIGIRARETVERGFSWERYTNALWEIVSASRSPSG